MVGWSSKEKALKRRGIEEITSDAILKATEHLEKQESRFLTGCITDDLVSDANIALRFDNEDAYRMNVRNPYLWGWFHSYSKHAGECSTPASGRATILMTLFLMGVDKISFAAARQIGTELDRGWNAADAKMEAIFELGSMGYEDSECINHLLEAFRKVSI